MKHIPKADPYVEGNSVTWKNWQSLYDEPKTCKPCEDKHGKFVSFEEGRLEIGRKLRSNLSVGPNSPVDCLAAKAATGGSPIIYTQNNCFLESRYFYPSRSLVRHQP